MLLQTRALLFLLLVARMALALQLLILWKNSRGFEGGPRARVEVPVTRAKGPNGGESGA